MTASVTYKEQQDEIDRLKAEIVKLHADAATVVHAYDAAGQVIEALIAFLPEGQVVDPRLATAKHNLDEARRVMQRPAPPMALKIACENIVRLTEQRDRLTGCLNAGMALIDTLMTELRHNATLALGPSLQLSAAYATWDKRVKELLGEDK